MRGTFYLVLVATMVTLMLALAAHNQEEGKLERPTGTPTKAYAPGTRTNGPSFWTATPSQTPEAKSAAQESQEMPGVQIAEAEGDTRGEPVGGHEDVGELVSQYAWPADVVMCIIERESGFDAAVINPDSGTRGWLQIRPSSHEERLARLGVSLDQLLDGPTNLMVGYNIWLDWSGFGAWNGSPQCWQ